MNAVCRYLASRPLHTGKWICNWHGLATGSGGNDLLNILVVVIGILTVGVSTRALLFARDSANSSSDAATSAKDTADAVKEMAGTVKEMARQFELARERDRTVADEMRLRDMLRLIEEIQQISRRVGSDTPDDWILARNLLNGLLRGYEDTFPVTSAAAQATSSRTGNLSASRVEIFQALNAMALRRKEIDEG